MRLASCKTVDNLIELAFDIREGSNQVWRPEVDLSIPDGYEEESARVDCAVTFDIPRDVLSSKAVRAFSHTCLDAPGTVISFVYIGATSDGDDAMEELRMALYAVQYQRRAMHLNEGPAFGAVFSGSLLQIFVSFWKEKRLVVRPIAKPFNLLGFARFIDCYIMLCAISQHQADFFNDEFHRMGVKIVKYGKAA